MPASSPGRSPNNVRPSASTTATARSSSSVASAMSSGAMGPSSHMSGDTLVATCRATPMRCPRSCCTAYSRTATPSGRANRQVASTEVSTARAMIRVRTGDTSVPSPVATRSGSQDGVRGRPCQRAGTRSPHGPAASVEAGPRGGGVAAATHHCAGLHGVVSACRRPPNRPTVVGEGSSSRRPAAGGVPGGQGRHAEGDGAGPRSAVRPPRRRRCRASSTTSGPEAAATSAWTCSPAAESDQLSATTPTPPAPRR
jgi:hypothetical protein